MILDLLARIERVFVQAFERVGLQGFPVRLEEAVRPEFGDYQINGVLAAAKTLKCSPRELANKLVMVVQEEMPRELERMEVAGPGFINLWLSERAMLDELNGDNDSDGDDGAKDECVDCGNSGNFSNFGDFSNSSDFGNSGNLSNSGKLGEAANSSNCALNLNKITTDARKTPFAPYRATGKVVVIDYSSPNLAKEMHVGHLRSTIIGDALVRLHQFVGHQVIRRNHIGDWGTQFGMLLAYMEENCLSGEQLNLALSDLEHFYRQAKLRFDQDDDFKARAHQMVVQLQSKEARVYQLWQDFVAISMQHCQEIYARLRVLLQPADAVGESWYNEMLPEVVADLLKNGIAVDDQGAKCVFFAPGELPQDSEAPFIIQKSDGAYLYATTDLAAAYNRVERLKADELLYVIDARQGLHMQQLFATLRRRGKLSDQIKAEHVAFGVMLGEDGRPFKTRDGGTVRLASLLDEAQRRAEAQLRARHADWSDDQIARTGEVLAVAAVKYADLAKNRISDYRFSFDQMLAWDGNTAPYLLYAYVRARSVLRKLQGQEHEQTQARSAGQTACNAAKIGAANTSLRKVTALPEEAERTLAKWLLKWDLTLKQAVETSYPHLLCSYLYQLATAFMKFYEHCQVQQAAPELRDSRLALVALTADGLRQGLDLLGIDVIEQM